MDGKAITLHDMLMQRRVPELRKQVSDWMVKGASKMRKNELVSALAHELLRPGNLDEILFVAGDIGWQVIQDAADVDDLLQVSATAVKYAKMFAELGYLQYEGDEQTGTVKMPIEIKEILSTMKKDGFYERKVRSDLLFAYSQAAANLYGVISQEELVDIINRQVEIKTDLSELLLSQTRHLKLDAIYCHRENYLVNIFLKESNLEDIYNILAIAAGKPRYVPTKETFLLYSDGDYYEKTAHTSHLKTMLTNSSIVSADIADKIVADIVFSLQLGASISDVLQILLQHGLVFQNDMLPALTNTIKAVHNSTRLWMNKGYTPNELDQMLSRLNGNNSRRASEKIKIGRNDPCPCGSGRKHKKCCGRYLF